MSGKSKRIKASRDLQAKVGTGNIDKKVVEQAQKVMEETQVDFAPLAKPDLDALQKAIKGARQDSSDTKFIMDSLRTPIMNLKANAGAFNYGFVSQLTGMMLLFFEGIDKPDGKVFDIAETLHKTILLALATEMKGDGGSAGKELLQAFEDMCRKYKPPAE